MQIVDGIAMSDGMNKKRHLYSFELISNIYHDNWTNCVPVGLNHDRTRTIGYGLLSGIYFEPGRAYITNRTYIMENDEDRKQLLPIITAWQNRTFIQGKEKELDELKALIEEHLSSNYKVAPVSAVAIWDRNIVLRVFPDLKVLCDDDNLIELSNLEAVLPGVYKRGKLLLFASTKLRRNCCLGNSLNSEFLSRFQSLSTELPSLRLKIRLDFDLIGLLGTEHEDLEYSYWWGPKFSDGLEDIPKGVTHYENDHYDNLFSNLTFTEFGWYYQDEQKTLEIEEVIDKPNLIEDNCSFIGCRYIHSFISNDTHLPAHLDGAIRAYTEDKMISRLNTPLNKTGRDTCYTKLWRIDGDIPVCVWKELISHYYRDNHLIGEYFQGVDENNQRTSFTKSQVQDQKAAKLDITMFLPAMINQGDGLRIYFYYDKAIQQFTSDIIVQPLTYTVIEGEKRNTIEYDTNSLLKLIHRNGASVEIHDCIEVTYEDVVLNFPHFQCSDDQSVDVLINSLRQLFTAMSRECSYALFSCSFSVNINPSESIVVSFVGNVLDFVTVFDHMAMHFSANNYSEWFEELYNHNSNFGNADFNPNPFNMIGKKGLKYPRVDVPEGIISSIEVNQCSLSFELPEELRIFMNENNITIVPSYTIEESLCSKCKNDYKKCDCIKFVDENIFDEPTAGHLLRFTWTDRPAQ